MALIHHLDIEDVSYILNLFTLAVAGFALGTHGGMDEKTLQDWAFSLFLYLAVMFGTWNLLDLYFGSKYNIERTFYGNKEGDDQ